MKKDDELTKYMTIIEQYKEQINQLELQSQYVQAAIMEYSKSKITLEQLDKSEKGTEIIVPIGGSTYIYAQAKETSKVLFDIGAGLVTEKTIEDSLKKIDERIENLQKSQEKIIDIIQNLQNEAAEISNKAQILLSEGKK